MSSGINPNAPAIASLSDVAAGVEAALHDLPPPPPAQAAASQRPMTAGQMLRAAREAAGLHVAALAVALKVPVRKLEALEADQLSATEDAVFVRALAASVCRSVKVDAAPILALLPQSSRVRLDTDERAINRQFTANTAPARVGWLEQLSKPMLLGAVALVVGAFVLVMLPDMKAKMDASNAASQAAAPTNVAMAPPAAGGETVLGSPQSPSVPNAASAAATISASVATPSTGALAPQLSAATALSSVPTASAVASPASSSGASNGSGPLTITAIGEVWIEVNDATGKNLVRKTLAAGEAASAGGTMPLKVTIGRADSVKVSLRGQAFDLAPHNRENVARFEVK